MKNTPNHYAEAMEAAGIPGPEQAQRQHAGILKGLRARMLQENGREDMASRLQMRLAHVADDGTLRNRAMLIRIFNLPATGGWRLVINGYGTTHYSRVEIVDRILRNWA